MLTASSTGTRPDALLELGRRFAEAGDAESAGKAAELAGKLREGRIAVAFAGHFSAGKSSLVNALCGKPLLPTGPLPTSANLVRIAHGREKAAFVRDARGERRLSLDGLDEACRDGRTYPRIEILAPCGLLEGGLELIDTPGVDSTDDAHREATEASLYLADVVFFVTDYNHVLSETNLDFLRRLEERQKPYAVLVNQVDKHRSWEMPFSAYRRQVERALRDWHLVPFAVLYVSVKAPDHPLSEWDRLAGLLERLKAHAGALASCGAARSALDLIRQHADRRFAQAEDGEDGHPEEAVREAEARLAAVRRKQDACRREPEEKRQAFLRELAGLIGNAQLMTADVRERAAAYLQSRRPGFRAGLLFAARKTERERRERLAAFRDKLAEHVESRLVWHLNDWLGPRFRTELAAEELAGVVREGALVNDAYVMTYCQMVEQDIKSRYRRRAIEVYDGTVHKEHAAAAEAALAELAADAEAAEAAMAEAGRRLATHESRRRLVEEWSAPFRDAAGREALDGVLAGMLADLRPAGGDAEDAGGGDESRAGVPASDAGAVPAEARAAEREKPEEAGIGAAAPAPRGEPAFRYRSLLERAAERLADAAGLIADVPALAAEREALLARADNMRNHRFTVALFGAFSAGKSSFANALFGSGVLPVSPNPTTASINAVLPPDGGHPHGTILVRMKTEEELMADLRHSLSMLGLPADDIRTPGQAAGILDRMPAGAPAAKGRAHVSFIRAAAAGYDAVKDRLGGTLRADPQTYGKFAAEEETACFVKSIDLHLATPLAGQGVVLVDTPGADSIHARHTGVTFGYIRQADAIVYVTYYNHAFSRADRRFLEQLGRVKEAFELDRMFFIVNAADLAESEEELGQVLERVERELARHGIRNPRLFAVSSREALEAKRTGDRQRLERSGFAAFEAAFARFAEEELAGTLLEAARRELMRVRGKIRRLAEQKLADRHHRLERAADMERAVPGLLREWRAEAAARGLERIRRELAELTHHVKKRCQYRFGDMFAETFHPSVLRDDGRGAETALVSAYHELVQMASAYVTGEMLATGLRMEQWVVREASAWRREAAERLAGLYPEWTEGAWEPEPADMPGVEDGLDLPPVSAGQLVRRFKSARSFFEGGGRDAMRGWLESLILDAACRHADRAAAVFADAFAGRFERLMEAACAGLSEDVLRFARALADGGAGETAATDWRELSERFERLVEDPCFSHVAVTP